MRAGARLPPSARGRRLSWRSVVICSHKPPSRARSLTWVGASRSTLDNGTTITSFASRLRMSRDPTRAASSHLQGLPSFRPPAARLRSASGSSARSPDPVLPARAAVPKLPGRARRSDSGSSDPPGGRPHGATSGHAYGHLRLRCHGMTVYPTVHRVTTSSPRATGDFAAKPNALRRGAGKIRCRPAPMGGPAVHDVPRALRRTIAPLRTRPATPPRRPRPGPPDPPGWRPDRPPTDGGARCR